MAYENQIKCPVCGISIPPNAPDCDSCNAKYEGVLNDVISLMKRDYGENIVDYNMVDDDRVELLDKDENVVKVISERELTHLWNEVE